MRKWTREVSNSGLNDGDIGSKVDLTEVKVQSCAAGYDALGHCLITQRAPSPAPRIDLQSFIACGISSEPS
jgi:hypothetical protein